MLPSSCTYLHSSVRHEGIASLIQDVPFLSVHVLLGSYVFVRHRVYDMPGIRSFFLNLYFFAFTSLFHFSCRLSRHCCTRRNMSLSMSKQRPVVLHGIISSNISNQHIATSFDWKVERFIWLYVIAGKFYFLRFGVDIINIGLQLRGDSAPNRWRKRSSGEKEILSFCHFRRRKSDNALSTRTVPAGIPFVFILCFSFVFYILLYWFHFVNISRSKTVA